MFIKKYLSLLKASLSSFTFISIYFEVLELKKYKIENKGLATDQCIASSPTPLSF